MAFPFPLTVLVVVVLLGLTVSAQKAPLPSRWMDASQTAPLPSRWSDACLAPCFSEESDLFGFKMRLPCSVASGKLPLGVPPLPLYFVGNYDLCATFQQAHYCTIRTGILDPSGDVRINQCVSKGCTAAHIKHELLSDMDDVVRLASWFSSNKTRSGIEALRNLIADGLVVDCMEERPTLDAVGWCTVAVFAALTLLVLVATGVHACAGADPARSPARSPALVGLVECFSAKRNVGRLVDASSGTSLTSSTVSASFPRSG